MVLIESIVRNGIAAKFIYIFDYVLFQDKKEQKKKHFCLTGEREILHT